MHPKPSSRFEAAANPQLSTAGKAALQSAFLPADTATDAAACEQLISAYAGVKGSNDSISFSHFDRKLSLNQLTSSGKKNFRFNQFHAIGFAPVHRGHLQPSQTMLGSKTDIHPVNPAAPKTTAGEPIMLTPSHDVTGEL